MPDERGGSWSILVLLLVVAFILAAGLVVDGNRQAAAARTANATAAAAARAGTDAASTSRVADRVNTAAAAAGARRYLSSVQGVDGSVQVLSGGRLEVTVTKTVPTRYVSLIGIDTVTGRATVVADLIQTGGDR